MSDVLIGLAIGMGGAVVLSILSFILIRSTQASRDAALARANRREDDAESRQDVILADRDAAREAEKILHDNQQSLLEELAELKTKNAAQEAQIAALEATTNDLFRVLKDHPGALPTALVLAADRLRAQLSASGEAASAATSTDPSREGSRSVHGGPDALERPESSDVDVR